MSTALKIPQRMTVAEFLSWEPPYGWNGRWQLRDAEPEMMAPASDRHGSIQARLTYLLTVHLDARNSRCRVLTAPGAVPSERSADNCPVPDLGVTCAPPTDEHLMREPVVLIEILSPTNVSKTRLNVRAYLTISTVAEIVVGHSSAMVVKVLRRTSHGHGRSSRTSSMRRASFGSTASVSRRRCARHIVRRTSRRAGTLPRSYRAPPCLLSPVETPRGISSPGGGYSLCR